MSLFCISSSAVEESMKESPSTLCLCLYIYIASLKNHSITRLCQFCLSIKKKKKKKKDKKKRKKKDMFFSKVYIYCFMNFIQAIF